MTDVSPASELSDETLARAALHNPSAFAELYQRHVRRIYRYVLARVGTIHDAEDLTAETFSALMKSMHSYRGQGSFAAWLTIIARNTVANHYRARRSDVPLDAVTETPDFQPPTDEIVSRRLQLASVLTALDRLPDEYGEVVRLRIFGELSTAETAEVMGKSEGAVKMLLHRALRDLRKQVGVYAIDEVES
ncbi:MAG: RNA polymerase sigma factor [Chloroflexota bacterium]